MKHTFIKSLIPLLFPCLFFIASHSLYAQSIEIFGGNVINGSVTGTMLGAATMGLYNTNDFTYLKTGLGAGTIAGAAIAIYDLATLPRGQQLFISGAFNDGRNSSIILLLDTFYGAAGGAFIGTASMLIADRPLLEGLQYGTSAGAWIGFAFGLADSFFIAERNRDFIAETLFDRESLSLIETRYKNTVIGFGEPRLVSTSTISNGTVHTNFHPAVGVISFTMDL
ncbi:MAG: hypothetical protein WD035_10095 [Balneolaceae bacterium]